MKRRLWLLMPFAAQAQDFEQTKTTGETVREVKIERGARQKATPIKRANNECPVCGTVASPYKRQPQPNCGDITLISVDLATSKLVYKSACEKPDKVPANLTRCNHCNNAFWQDAV